MGKKNDKKGQGTSLTKNSYFVSNLVLRSPKYFPNIHAKRIADLTDYLLYQSISGMSEHVYANVDGAVEGKDLVEGFEVRISGGILRKYTNKFYKQFAELGSQLEKTGHNIASRGFSYYDSEGTFNVINVYQRFTYDSKSGDVVVVYTPAYVNFMKTHMRQNYTILDVSVAVKWKRQYTSNLYQYLLQSKYRSKQYLDSDAIESMKMSIEPGDYYVCEINLARLKFILGCYDIEHSSIVNFISHAVSDMDYEKMESYYPNDEIILQEEIDENGDVVAVEKKIDNRKIKEFFRFKKDILVPSWKEINGASFSEIVIDDVLEIRSNRKVKTLVFVFHDDSNGYGVVEENIMSKEQQEIFDSVANLLIDFDVKRRDVEAVCVKADWNVDKVRKALKSLKAQKKNVDNKIGFILSAIENDYSVPKSANDDKGVNQFNNFRQRTYDFEEMERNLFNFTHNDVVVEDDLIDNVVIDADASVVADSMDNSDGEEFLADPLVIAIMEKGVPRNELKILLAYAAALKMDKYVEMSKLLSATYDNVTTSDLNELYVHLAIK